MKHRKRRVTAMLLALMMVITMLPLGVLAEGGTKTVTVSIEKFVLGQGYIMEPTMVTVPEDATVEAAINQALTQTGHTANITAGYYGSYIAGVTDPNRGEVQVPQKILDALAAANLFFVSEDATPDTLDAGDYELTDYGQGIYAYSGWLFSVNNVFSSTGISDTTVNEGDVIRVQFSLTGESDVNGNCSWETPVYPNYANRTDLTRALAEINHKKLSNPSYLTQNNLQTAYDTAMSIMGDFESTQAQVNTAYTALTGKNSDITATDGQPEPVVTPGVKTSEEVVKQSGNHTEQYILGQGAAKYGAEWNILGLARAEAVVPQGYYETYLQSVVDEVQKKQGILEPGTTARVVLVLSALKQDVTNVGGYNLLENFNDLENVTRNGVYGPIYVLLALDSNNYQLPENRARSIQTTREGLVQYILNQEITYGGWGWQGVADVDTTAMAIQALTPYYHSNAEVKAAVDRGLTVLSGLQCEDGSYSSYGICNAESTAQLIVALPGMGINPTQDARFVKNGYTTIDGLMKFAVNGGGFSHELGNSVNNLATAQGYYALVAYQRLINGQPSLYQMSDAKGITTTTVTEPTPAATGNSENTETSGSSAGSAATKGNSVKKAETILKTDSSEEVEETELLEELPETLKKNSNKEEKIDNSENKDDNWKKIVPIAAILLGGSGVGILVVTGKKKAVK
ncbi:MAG: DUF4430 domain-containing protein [Lachnospiraceae bacterium]